MTVRKPARLPLTELAPWILEVPGPPTGNPAEQPPPVHAPLDWRAVFGNDHPVELEVGFGKGLFLLNACEAMPAVNWVGVEIVRKYHLLTATRLAKRGRTNVKVAWADAKVFLRDSVAERSLQAVHVYFPDPWWKKRHEKRRLFTADFVDLAARALRVGGRFHLATDVEDYFAMARELVAAEPRFLPLPPPEPTEGSHDLDYLTNFERKFRKQGKPIYRSLHERRSS